MADGDRPRTLAPPAVTALRGDAPAEDHLRGRMERTLSENIREEREDLREAAEHSLNVILDLGLDGSIRWVSPSWQDVVGNPPESVTGKPIADILFKDKTAFADAVESIRTDDSRSKIIRFAVSVGPSSVLFPKRSRSRSRPSQRLPENDHPSRPNDPSEEARAEEHAGSGQIITLEAQGIMVYERTTGNESHTMWMIRPYVMREVTIDLPDVLVKSLGVGAEMLAHYLTQLAEAGATEVDQLPPPPPILCRICERHIKPWWFEKHTELCLQEHKAEMDVQLAHEQLSDHRNSIVKVLDALEAHIRQPRPTSGEVEAPALPIPEYKGMVIRQNSTPNSTLSSGRSSPASPPPRSRERSTATGFSHHRARSFHVRRPVSRIVELVLDLCDTALEINTPALKDTRGLPNGDFRTQSPSSESRITQVLQWQSPSTSTVEQEQGLAALCDDTASMAKVKVDAVFRHRHILEYSERIRVEFEVLVQECIEAAIRKAYRIANGEVSDSGSDTEEQAEEQTEDSKDSVTGEPSPDRISGDDDGIFPGSFEGPSAMATALRNVSDPALVSEASRKASSVSSTRSSSPRGCQTPRSYGGAVSLASQSKRQSMHFESDTGADSDGSARSSALSRSGSVLQRGDSPSSELGLARVATSRERKRRSLILPSLTKSRQQSPARSMPPPSSPLRMAKNRVPSGTDASQSPVTSPVLSTSEFSSPAIAAAQLHHHRRQSSTASSQILGPQISPRLMPVSSNPQPRAVPPSIKDFEIIKPISKGAFGSVYLSKKKSTGDYFAIKVLKKADMVVKNQVTNVKAERAIMMWQGESDFVAKLYWTFSSKDFLYLVMEYLNGGDLACLTKVLGGLPEDWTKKYIAEVVLGVEHLHSRGIVHRDLKPDNLLIDQKGHLKLTDFGLSRMGLIGRQKRALKALEKKTEEPVPDLLRQGPFYRAVSVGSSRSASFDLQGASSPSQTPSLTPAFGGELVHPSYFSLNRESSTASSQEPSRRTSGHRSDSENSESLQSIFRRLSLADPASSRSIEEETMSEDGGSPDPYALQPSTSHLSDTHNTTPPAASGMLPPQMALFDPQDASRKFVGTPDYLAPETINGAGQDEVSDWWSLGCILFECVYGYPPFHADTPEQVFENILARKIDWPPEDVVPVSPEAKDLISRLMCMEPAQRLGANMDDKFSSGGEEVRHHPWFADVHWGTLREDEASFVPAADDPENTEYFDTRGATLQSFAAEFEDQGTSSAGTPGADYPERPHDALSRVRSQIQVTSAKRGLMPLHIPPHVRDGRNRRLSEPVPADDFGNFAFKNLPVLEKANKDVIQKLRAEALQAQNKPASAIQSPTISSPTPSLDSSPILPMPLKRTMSSNKGNNRPASPLMFSQPGASPNRASQPSSPLLVSFSAGHNHERRKTSSGSSTQSQQTSGSLQPPGNFFDIPRLSTNFKTSSTASSPIKLAKSPSVSATMNYEKGATLQRQSSVPQARSSVSSPRARAQTVGSQGSQESDDVVKDLVPTHHKRRSQVIDLSPSSSDTEDSRQKQALLRVQRRRQSSRRLSQITFDDGPVFRPLDVLVCEDHPVSRLVMEKLLDKLKCRSISVQTGSEAIRYATSQVKFDIIFMEFKLPQINGADVARMIRETKNANTNTPIVTITGYLKDLPPQNCFDALIEKPPTIAKLTEVLGKTCQWRQAPPNWTPTHVPLVTPSASRQESSLRSQDSPVSQASSYPAMPSGSYRGSSREDSISSSMFGDTDSRSDDVPVIISRQATDEWRDRDLARVLSGFGIHEEPLSESIDAKRVPASLQPQQSSAPAVLEHVAPRKRRSHEPIPGKRRSLETKQHESAESGDDEDEELGNVQVRAKSPKGGRARGSSKLGTEMMRTNSHGSVVSVEEVKHAIEDLPNSPPPVISEEPPPEQSIDKQVEGVEVRKEEHHPVSLTPPEIFPRAPGDVVKEIDMDATPKSKESGAESPDPDPTPRPSISRSQSKQTSSPSPGRK